MKGIAYYFWLQYKITPGFKLGEAVCLTRILIFYVRFGENMSLTQTKGSSKVSSIQSLSVSLASLTGW